MRSKKKLTVKHKKKESSQKNKREKHRDDRHVMLKNQILQQEPTLDEDTCSK